MSEKPLLRLMVAPLTAGLLWLAFPGGGEFWPLLLCALAPFLSCIVGERKGGQAFLTGFLTGFCHFLLSLYWLVTVLGHYGGLPLYLAVPALVLLAAYMGLFVAGFAWAARLFWRRWPPWAALWLIPALWVGLDWCRSFLLSGFPWMDLGYGLASVPWLLQSVDLWGHYGLTFLVVLFNTLLAAFFVIRRKSRRQPDLWLKMTAPVLLLCCGVAGYSFWQWRQMETALQTGPRLRVGVVQGNIAQDQKWSPNLQAQTVQGYSDQSRELIARGHAALLVWPETALPFYPQGLFPHPLLQPVAELARQGKFCLLTGAPEQRPEAATDADQAGREVIRYYNSALLFDVHGQISSRYSKSHLVPFGEYIPLKTILPFLAPVVEAVGDFSAGTISQPLSCEKAKIGVLICFESIFPQIARMWVNNKANLLVNLTNDAWYGRSSAPHHSLAMTVLRAVETRRSLVRAANTGFSGFIDPLGRRQKISPLFEPWAAATEVVLMEYTTVFVRWGWSFAPFCLLAALLALGGAGLFRPRPHEMK